jgi:hypothetical protein
MMRMLRPPLDDIAPLLQHQLRTFNSAMAMAMALKNLEISHKSFSLTSNLDHTHPLIFGVQR